MLKGIIATSLCILFVFIAGTALALEFSADTVSTTGKHKVSGKIYYTDDKFRTDIKSPQDMTMIVRQDKKIVWNIMHDQKMYMEMPISAENRPRVSKEFEGEIERKLIGKETIDGHPTEKYLITYKVRDHTDQVYQWIATDLNFPIKTEDVDGNFTQEYKNIKMEKQDDSLFEIPKGYKKFDVPVGTRMPGGMKTQ